MDDSDGQYDVGDSRRPRQPWFGPKQFGSG
jgi:hypothetical protein